MTARDYPLDPYWIPFTSNQAFKAAPRMFVAAKDMHYTTDDGRQVLDGTAGLWCVNAGHCRPAIVEAIQRQVATMDYSPAFQMGHPGEFRAAKLIAEKGKREECKGHSVILRHLGSGSWWTNRLMPFFILMTFQLIKKPSL